MATSVIKLDGVHASRVNATPPLEFNKIPITGVQPRELSGELSKAVLTRLMASAALARNTGPGLLVSTLKVAEQNADVYAKLKPLVESKILTLNQVNPAIELGSQPEHADAFEAFTDLLYRAEVVRASLILNVSASPVHREHLDLAVLVAVDSEANTDAMSQLNQRLNTGSVTGRIEDELDRLMPKVEKPKPKPAPAPRRTRRVVPTTPVPRATAPVRKPTPPPAPVIDLAAIDNQVDHNIDELFPVGEREAAKAMYSEFKGRPVAHIENVVWRNVFHLLGVAKGRAASQMLPLFGHLLNNHTNLSSYTNESRITNALALMDTVLTMPNSSPIQEITDRAFAAVFMSSPSVYTGLTDRQFTQVQELLPRVAENRERRVIILEAASRDQTGNYLNLILDPKRITRAGNIMHSIVDLCKQHGVEIEDQDLLFRGMYDRTPGEFNTASSLQNAQDLVKLRGDAGRLEPLGEFKNDRILLLARNPHLTLSLTSAADLIRQGLPTRIRRSLASSTGFIAMPVEEQKAMIQQLRRLSSSKIVEQARSAANAPSTTSGSRDRGDRSSELERPRALVTVHGYLVCNPAYVEVEHPGEVSKFFMHVDSPLVDSTALRNLQITEGLNYEQREILQALMNTREGDYSGMNYRPPESVVQGFELPVSRLHELMSSHGNLASVYSDEPDLLAARDGQSGLELLNDDLRQLALKGFINLPEGRDVDAARLSELLINVSDDVGLNAEAEAKLVKLPTSLGPQQKLDRQILLAIARSPNYLATISEIRDACGGVEVLNRLSALEDQGLIVNPRHQETRLLSPHALKSTEMQVPGIYYQQYKHVIDAVTRFSGMYHISFSGERQALREAPDRVERRMHAIVHAIELGRGRGAALDVVDRRVKLTRLLCNVDLDLDHGSKLENIKDAGTELGLKAGTVEGVLDELTKAEIIERVALGYYRIKQDYWRQIPLEFNGIEYSKKAPTTEYNGNIDQERIDSAVEATPQLKTADRKTKAKLLLRLLSHQHMNIQYCARVIDLRDLLQMAGEFMSTDTIRNDFENMTNGVEARSATRRREGNPRYNPLTSRDPSGLYWRFQIPLTNMTPQEAVEYIPEDTVIYTNDLNPIERDRFNKAIGVVDPRRRFDVVPLKIDDVVPDQVRHLEGKSKYVYFLKTKDGVYGVTSR